MMTLIWCGPSRPAAKESEVVLSVCIRISRALVFLVAVFGICVSTSFSQTLAPTDPDDISALIAFRTTLSNSQQMLPSWYLGGDPCALWAGVMCVQADYPDSLRNSNMSHVTELRLLRLNLVGTLAPELGSLKALKIFDVMWNNMTGSIPDTFGNLSNLFLLLLNGNHFSGILPASIGNLAGLNRIQIDENQISGPLPTSFKNLMSIQHLHMNNNSISGSIPPELGQLPNLVHLLLDNNNVSGKLPPELSNISTLMILQLDNNHFDAGATIPAEYGKIPSLLKLSLRNCSLVGEVPDMSQSTELGVIDLSFNKLNGSISGFPPQMTAIDLSDNELSGSVPAELGNLGNLSFLLLSNNNISGIIPTNLGSIPPNNDSSSTFIWDFQNNSISSWPNNETLIRSGQPIWFAGNPLCAGNTLAAVCLPSSVDVTLQIGSAINASSNKDSTCGKCPPDFFLVPNAQSRAGADFCRCAVPIIVWYRLKSPGFNVFDLYERGFLIYISSGLGLSLDQVDLFDYTTEPGPRISMHLGFFPLTDSYFNSSEIQRISNFFSEWEIPDDPVFGPYELLRLTVVLPPGSKSSLSGGAVAGIVLGAVAVLLLLLIGLWLVVFRKREVEVPLRRKGLTQNGTFSKVKATGLQEWTWEEMEQFTNRFSDTNVLGVGGFGKVYVGVLPDGSKVAIKRAGLAAGSNEQFETEIELLSRVHHRNLVELKGFCSDEVSGDQFLVYEFMVNGTVEDHLPPHSTTPLDFPTRLRVALGAARGINYLHTEANPPIFHRDIKASNILLDAKFNAKVADFGVSKNAPQPDEEGGVGGGVDTLVKGTPGYLDPEYCLTHTLTDKSDVYSFGVFLMVLLTGRQAITQGKNIIRHGNLAKDADMLWSLVDPYMAGQCPADIAEAWARLALRCCEEDPNDRPSMSGVVLELDALNKECAMFRSETDSTTPSSTGTVTMTSTSDTSDTTTQSWPTMHQTPGIMTNSSGVNLMSDYDGKNSAS
ncbi:hypothetical protein Mapa_009286 [Marchantia paleacea]|nr:hypothetical protein Mapa_009286 [Marchantia paleacea]